MRRQLLLLAASLTTLVAWSPPCFYGKTLSIRLDPPRHRHRLTTEQRERALALTLFGEARSDGWEGMRAVGNVVMNRVRAGQRRFGDYHVEDVVWSRKQFSCWNRGDPNREILRRIGRLEKHSLEEIRWTQAKGLAHMLVQGRAGVDPTGGATSYHTVTIRPYWSASMQRTAVIDGHVFYRAKRKGPHAALAKPLARRH